MWIGPENTLSNNIPQLITYAPGAFVKNVDAEIKHENEVFLNSSILSAVGDVFLGDSPHLIGHGAGSSIDRIGWKAVGAGIRSLLGEADHHFVNLETVVSHKGRNRLSDDGSDFGDGFATITVLPFFEIC